MGKLEKKIKKTEEEIRIINNKHFILQFITLFALAYCLIYPMWKKIFKL